MKPALSEFQDNFAHALYGGEPMILATVTGQPGFQVYRNSVIKAASDALLANFPTVERLVGREWLRAAAAIYVHQAPPTDARLIFYGETFADFLDDFPPARDLPYLGNVARLDYDWNCVHGAEDETAINLGFFASLDPDELGQSRLKPMASSRWRWVANQPAYSIWRINREAGEMPEELDWSGEGALLSRINGQVHWQSLSRGGCAFLDACTAGLALEQATDKALHDEPDLDLMALLTLLVNAQVLTHA